MPTPKLASDRIGLKRIATDRSLYVDYVGQMMLNQESMGSTLDESLSIRSVRGSRAEFYSFGSCIKLCH